MGANQSSSRYQKYVNFGQQVSGGGTINNVFHNQPAPSVFDLLRPDFVPDALYNSTKRRAEHAVICQPETQTKVLHDIRTWAISTTGPPVCWLTGPAGSGKTTVAHTVAEEYDQRGRLAATFFFWRKTGDRDDIHKLAPTLAWQIAEKIPSAETRIEQNLKAGSMMVAMIPLWNTSIEDQLSKLVGITDSEPTDPDLVIIDGLDECESQAGIYRLIDWICINQLPFRFLLTSRPEPEIKARLQGRPNVQTLSLTESRADIRRYFVERLEDVWPKRQRIWDSGPLQWPSKVDINKLVKQSEGLFVYAATAVRYIGGEGYPVERLAKVLRLHSGLDSLFAQVIEEAAKRDNFDLVMGSLMYLRYPLNIDELSEILLPLNEYLTTPGILSALRRCHSILVIPQDNTPIKSHHASLRDFLTNRSRSGTLFRSPATCHGQLMFGCLSVITRAFEDNIRAPEYPLLSWYYHACSFLSADKGLKETKDEELLKKIDLEWVKYWISESLYWAGSQYLIMELTANQVR